jgi:putative peptide zinc metalloprotease protein
MLYGPASFAYRFWLIAFIAFNVAEKYLTLGIMLGLWAMLGYAWPFLRGASGMARGQPEGQRATAALRLSGAFAAVLLLLFVVPVPRTVVTQGAFTMPEDAALRPLVSGRVAEVLVPQGAMVQPGQAVLRLEDPELAARVAKLEARLAEKRAIYASQLYATHGRSVQRQEELTQAERELAEARRDTERLVLRASGAGQLAFPNPADLPGRWLHRGEQVAALWDPARAELRAMVPMAEIGAVRDRLRSVTVRPGFARQDELPAEVLRIVPAATDQLPDPVLALDGGGPFAVAQDREGHPRLQEAMYEVDLRLADPLPLAFLHGRAHVRFAVGWEPAGVQLWRRLRMLFLRRLYVS